MTLSKREKSLIFVMVLIGIVLVFVMLIILPTNQKIQDNKLLKSELELKQSEIQMKLALEKTLEAKQVERLQQINDSLKKIEDPLLPAEFERWVLPLTTKYRMPIIQASLSDEEVVAPDAKQLTINAPSYELKTMIMEYKKETEDADLIPTTESVLVKQTHTYEVATSYTNYKAFLDEITDWDTSIFIADSSYDFTNYRATFAFDVYSIHKIEETSDKDYNGDYTGTSYRPGGTSTNPGNPSNPSNPDINNPPVNPK